MKNILKISSQKAAIALFSVISFLLFFGESGARPVSGTTQNQNVPAQKGGVNGYVKDPRGNPLEQVSVSLKGKTIGTTTDKQGYFMIRNIPEGTYVLTASFIGLTTTSQQVTVAAGETATVNFILNENKQELQEVRVSGSGINKMVSKETDYIAKMPLKNLENPQVYHVVSKELLDEQVNTTINNAFRNVPGAVVTDYPAGGLAILSRGFSTAINARNGLQSVMDRTSADPVNVERIEVLKGPAGTLYQGIGSYGGVVNLVTKKPMERPYGKLGYTTGSWGLNRTTMDFNTPVTPDKKVLLRINAAVNKENSFKDAGHNNTYTIAPSIQYKVDDRLTLNADLELFHSDKTQTGNYSSYGPYTDVAEVPIYKKSLFLDDVNAEASTLKAYLQAEYKLSANWKSSTNLAVVSEELKNSYQAYFYFQTADSLRREVSIFGPITSDYIDFQQNFTGNFNIGNLKNDFLAGIDINRYRYSHYSVSLLIDTVNVDRFKPLTKRQIESVYVTDGPYGPYGEYASALKNNRYGLYVSDVLHFTGRLSTMLSLRLDRYEYNVNIGSQSTTYEQTAWSPKLGMVYELVKDRLSLFGNFTDGFTNQNTGQKADGTVVNLDPEHATQYEAGLKLQSGDNKYSATASYYNIKVHNAILYDDAGYFESQDGKQESKGVELEFTGNPLKGLNVVAGYAYNDNRYTRSSYYEGKHPAGTPYNVVNFWLSYRFTDGSFLEHTGLGLGGNYVDECFQNSSNTVTVPAYTLLDATLFYETSKWRVGLKMNNLTDERYYSSYGVPQPTRQLIANVSFTL